MAECEIKHTLTNRCSCALERRQAVCQPAAAALEHVPQSERQTIQPDANNPANHRPVEPDELQIASDAQFQLAYLRVSSFAPP